MSEELSYGKSILEYYTDKTVEILFDADFGVQKWAEFDVYLKQTLIGKIVGGGDNCIMLEVDFSYKNKMVKKVVSVSTWSILSVSEYDNISHVFAFKQVQGKQQ